MIVTLLGGTVVPAGAVSLHHGMSSSKIGSSTETTKLTTISPDSASGTSGDITIYVVGSGSYVDSWWTSALPPKTEETYAAFWANGVVISTSNTVLVTSGNPVVAFWGGQPGFKQGQGTFPNGTQLCVTWLNIPGKPCETIEN